MFIKNDYTFMKILKQFSQTFFFTFYLLYINSSNFVVILA